MRSALQLSRLGILDVGWISFIGEREKMKRPLSTLKITVQTALLLAFGFTFAVDAQDARVQVNYLNRLAGRAVEHVDVRLDEELLRVLAASLKADDSSQSSFKDSVAGLKGVYVKGFKFGGAGEYTEADVEELRSQLRVPGWQKVADVRNKRGGDNGELFLRLQGDVIGGLVIISAEPAELYVINIVGNISLGRISFQEGVRGIARLDAEWNRWMKNSSRFGVRGSR
jgi:hypothetical protein